MSDSYGSPNIEERGCFAASHIPRVGVSVLSGAGFLDALRTLAAAPGVGLERLVFGTNLPFLIPESPLMELADARFTPKEASAIARVNALSFFAPPGS